jgi:peptide/nickel transport system substrate-binding protein
MRTDKANLPYKDVKVRRALMMATDFETIKNTWAGGDAQILTWPAAYYSEYKDAYVSLSEAPASVQELYTYSPDKARALLAEAGYSKGFDAKLTCSSNQTIVDYVSIVADMWSKVGVKLTLDLKETAVAVTIARTRNYEELLASDNNPIGGIYTLNGLSGQTSSNGSYINETYYNEMKAKIALVALTDPAQAAKLHKEVMVDALDKAWAIPAPYVPQYHFWWPWVKNYHGEYSVGYSSVNTFAKYVWIDQTLKKSMKH